MAIVRRKKREKKILAKRSKFGRGTTHELLISRSNLNIGAYVIDLVNGKTMFSISTMGLKKLGVKSAAAGKLEDSAKVGELLAKKCLELNIKPAINVAQYRFFGRVKALVDNFAKSLES